MKRQFNYLIFLLCLIFEITSSLHRQTFLINNNNNNHKNNNNKNNNNNHDNLTTTSFYNGFYIYQESNGRWWNANNERLSLLKLHYFTGTTTQTRWYIMEDEIKRYGAIETQQNPWKTTVWKEMSTKQETYEINITPFNNFCDDTSSNSSQLLLQYLLAQQSGVDTIIVSEEIILRSLLLLIVQDSFFTASSPSQFHSPPPVHCINILLSSSSVLDATPDNLSSNTFRILTTLCSVIDHFYGWTVAKECYSFLVVLTFHFGKEKIQPLLSYLQWFQKQYIPQYATTFPLVPRSEISQHTPLNISLDSSDEGNSFPSSFVGCLISRHNQLVSFQKNDNQSFNMMMALLLTTGVQNLEASELSCFYRMISIRLSLNLFRYEMDAELALGILSLPHLLLSTNPQESLYIFHPNCQCFFSFLSFLNGIELLKPLPSPEQCEKTANLLKLNQHSTFQDIIFQISFYFHRSLPLQSLTMHEILSLSSRFFALGGMKSSVTLFQSYVTPPTKTTTIQQNITKLFCSLNPRSCSEQDYPGTHLTALSNFMKTVNSFSNDPSFWEDISKNHQLLSYLTSMLIQLISPTISDSYSISTFSSIKNESLRLLEALASHCESLSNTCQVDESYLSTTVKGLFLAAYQGNLKSQTKESSPNSLLPNLYYRLLRSTSFLPVSNDFLPDIKSVTSSHSIPSHTNQRMKIGFLSSFFFRHSVGRLLGHLIQSLNHEVFEIILITLPNSQSKQEEDDLLVSLKSSADIWIEPKHSLSDIMKQIRSYELDILVFGDVLMDTLTTHVAMLRLATIQIAFWGHPYTTSFPTIDYFVTSDSFEPKNDELNSQISSHFNEQLIRFTSLSASFLSAFPQQEKIFPQQNKADYIHRLIKNGFDIHNRPFHHTWDLISTNLNISQIRVYSCLQSLMKMHAMFDEVITKILLQDNHSLIILSSSSRSKYYEQNLFQNRLFHSIRQSGGDERRVIFIPQSSPQLYNDYLCNADITLDPFPFGGGVTLSDSIKCHRPFITLPRYQEVHRIGYGILEYLNLTNEIMTAETVSSFVERAIELAKNVNKFQNILKMKESDHSLFGSSQVVEEWTQLFLQLKKLINPHTLPPLVSTTIVS